MKTPFLILTLALAFTLLSGCTESDFESVAVDVCASGERWTLGAESEDDRMYPGRNCISCHVSEGEGPTYVAAGTVMPTLSEADDCRGVSSIQVLLTGANGAEVSTTTNSVGNFHFSSAAIELPYTAKLIFEDGTERPMLTPQFDLNCANCHTAEGAANAPGRLTTGPLSAASP